MRTCRLFGHRYRFSTDGSVMRWTCRRGCGAGGEKEYDSPDAATRYAGVFGRDPVTDLGRRGPLIALLPLRVVQWLRRRHRRRVLERGAVGGPS